MTKYKMIIDSEHYIEHLLTRYGDYRGEACLNGSDSAHPLRRVKSCSVPQKDLFYLLGQLERVE